MKGKVLISVVLVAIAAAFIGSHLCCHRDVARMQDGWFGRGPEVKKDESIRPFEVNVSEEILADLKKKLNDVRLGEDLENIQFQYGFQVSYMKKVLEHWKSKFNWRKQEAELNKYPQFITNIEGIDVHFIQAKPARPTNRVLLLSHGWPGSIWEFHRILPMLTDPASHGGKEEDAIEVICPSIPGFGFSEAPHKPGFNPVSTARVYKKLMDRLGHDKYYVQGGDWGAVISTIMAQAYPEHVLGVHINFFFRRVLDCKTILKLVAGNYFPSLLGITPQQYDRYYPLSKFIITLFRELGYMHLQATRPDTLAFGLNDSPVGLAAYILEKFSIWTNPDYLNRMDGGLTEKYSLDDALTNVMIYWVTGTIGSSVRYYKEIFDGNPEVQAWDREPVNVPTCFADFPHELFSAPRPVIETKYRNIIHFPTMPSGGHFAAFEEPKLLRDDIITFIGMVEEIHG